MNRVYKWSLVAAASACVMAAQADMGFFQGTASGTYGWSSTVGSGSASNSSIGGGHFNPTNDGFRSNESSPATNPIEKSWFYWRKGTSNIEVGLNSTQSSNSILQSEDTTQVGMNTTRSLVVNQKDPGTGSQILQFTITCSVVPVGAVSQTDPGSSKANLIYDWSIKNISTSSQAFSFYYMGDLMATRNGSSGNADDTLSLINGGIGQKLMRAMISSPQGVGTGTGTIPTIYVTAFSQANAVSNAEFDAGTTPLIRTKMTDSVASAALTGSTANVTGNVALGIQYDLNLAAGATTSGRVTLGYNVVPEPGTVLPLVAGVAALVLRRNRRKA